MFEPPVSTPISRMMAREASRIRWYSLSVSVWAGATVMESPVCTPIGIEVLDRADDDHVVGEVAHHLELELLPADHRLLDEDLARRALLKTPLDRRLELLGVVGDGAAGASEGERGADDDGEADAVGRVPATASS